VRRSLRYSFLLTPLLLLWAVVSACGTQQAVPSTPTEVPVPIEALDGQTDIDVSSSFSYTFDQAVDTSTVTAGTFFMTGGSSASASGSSASAKGLMPGDDICDPSDAIDATVSCPRSTECILDPVDDLESAAPYFCCLTEDILYENGDSFEFFSAAFITALVVAQDTANCGGSSCESVFSSSACNNGEGVADYDSYNYNYPGLLYMTMDLDDIFISRLDGFDLAECIAAQAYASGEEGCVSIASLLSGDVKSACTYDIVAPGVCDDLRLEPDAAQPLELQIPESDTACVNLITAQSGQYTVKLDIPVSVGTLGVFSLFPAGGGDIINPDWTDVLSSGLCGVWSLDTILPYRVILMNPTVGAGTISVSLLSGINECPQP